MNSKAQACRDCGRVTKDLYWYGVRQSKMKQPRCSVCHQIAVQRDTRPREIDYIRGISYFRGISYEMPELTVEWLELKQRGATDVRSIQV